MGLPFGYGLHLATFQTLGLFKPHVVEWHIELALKSQLAVPSGFPVADE